MTVLRQPLFRTLPAFVLLMRGTTLAYLSHPLSLNSRTVFNSCMMQLVDAWYTIISPGPMISDLVPALHNLFTSIAVHCRPHAQHKSCW
jgi:hypothetical protein